MNTVTLTIQSPPDKQGNVTFLATWDERGVVGGTRTAQYHGKVEDHRKFWTERRGREVRIIEYVPKKKGKK